MSKSRKRIMWPMLLGMSAFIAFTLASAKTRTAKSAADARSSIDLKSAEQLRPAANSAEAVAQPGNESATLSAVAQSDAEKVEVEVITVRPSGFEPREITRRAGVFMLAITNQTGATELALHLDPVQGNRVQEVRLPKGKVRWNKIFDLPPGDYVLSEQNHPDWICHIKLTAR